MLEVVTTGEISEEFEMLRELQRFELGLASAARMCGYMDLLGESREVGRQFETAVSADMGGDLLWLAEFRKLRQESGRP